VATIFKMIIGDRPLRSFGAFSVRCLNARAARNPRNGESVVVPEKAAPFFRAGKDLRLRVDVDKVPKERSPLRLRSIPGRPGGLARTTSITAD
jgi:hypothetical protein